MRGAGRPSCGCCGPGPSTRSPRPAWSRCSTGTSGTGWTRLRRAADRARYLAAHALARLVLAPLVGRPPAALVLRPPLPMRRPARQAHLPGGPAFSFTHGGDLVGVAVRIRRRAGGARRRTGPGADRPGRDGRARRAPPAELAAGPAAVRTASSPRGPARRRCSRRPATASRPRWPRSPSSPDGVAAWTGAGAPAGPVWLRDLHPAPGYRAAVAGLGRPPGAVVEHGRPGAARPRARP